VLESNAVYDTANKALASPGIGHVSSALRLTFYAVYDRTRAEKIGSRIVELLVSTKRLGTIFVLGNRVRLGITSSE
jgi:hypothetical protein